MISILGLAILSYVLYGFMRFKKVRKKYWDFLVLLLCLLLIFVFADGFSINMVLFFAEANIFSAFLALVAILSVISFYRKFFNFLSSRGSVQTVFLLAVVITVIYTEYFNGIYSFSNKKVFYSYNFELKKYYFLAPIKIVEADQADQEHYGQDVQVYYLVSKNNLVYVKKDGDKLYYLRFLGWGEGSRWFQFGIPEGLQQ